MKDKLTLKQQAFIDYYLGEARGNATKAYQLAGYAGNETTAGVEGHKLLKNPKIKQAIEKGRESIAEKTGVTQEWIVDKLRENLDRAMQNKAVLDNDGNPIGEYRYEGAVANRSLELLGKNQGMFSEKHEHTLSGTVTVIIEK